MALQVIDRRQTARVREYYPGWERVRGFFGSIGELAIMSFNSGATLELLDSRCRSNLTIRERDMEEYYFRA